MAVQPIFFSRSPCTHVHEFLSYVVRMQVCVSPALQETARHSPKCSPNAPPATREGLFSHVLEYLALSDFLICATGLCVKDLLVFSPKSPVLPEAPPTACTPVTHEGDGLGWSPVP